MRLGKPRSAARAAARGGPPRRSARGGGAMAAARGGPPRFVRGGPPRFVRGGPPRFVRGGSSRDNISALPILVNSAVNNFLLLLYGCKLLVFFILAPPY